MTMRSQMTEIEIMNFALDFNNLIGNKNGEIGRLKAENKRLAALVSSLSKSTSTAKLTADDVRYAARGVWIESLNSKYKSHGQYAIPLNDGSGVLTGEKHIFRYEHYGKTWVAFAEMPQPTGEGEADEKA